MSIIERLKSLLEADTKIQDELEKEDPSVKMLFQLYQNRALHLERIKKEYPVASLVNLNPIELNEINGLFGVITKNNTVIQEKLITLSRKKEKQLAQISRKRQAESVYRKQDSKTFPNLMTDNLRG